MDFYSIFFFIFFIILIVSCTYESRDAFRYHVKFVFYGVYSTIIAIILLPYVILTPGNVKNARHAAIFLRWYTKFLGIEWELRGDDQLKQMGACVIVINHQSILDILGLFNIWHVLGDVAAVAKNALFWVVPFGPIAWLAGTVFIDRRNSKKSMMKLMEATDRIKNHTTKLVIFPEGTRNTLAFKNGLRPFKKGAFKIAIDNHLPILPIVYSPYYFINGQTHFFGHGRMIVKALPPITTENLRPEDLDELVRRTQSTMQTEFYALATEVFPFLPEDYPKKI